MDEDVLIIKYFSGCMTINLPVFIGQHKITAVRKLLKVIRSSDTPECEQKLVDWIIASSDEDDYNREQKNLANRVVDEREEKHNLEYQISGIELQREKFKKASITYKQLSVTLRDKKKQLMQCKSRISCAESRFKENQRNMDFYKTVLQELKTK